MSALVIDTNVLIRYLGDKEPFADQMEAADAIVISPVVYAEFMNGIDETTQNGMAQRKLLESFLDAPAVTLGAITSTTAIYYTKIHRYLKSIGSMIPQNDIWIAASALEFDQMLATHDSHFNLIPMLRRVAI